MINNIILGIILILIVGIFGGMYKKNNKVIITCASFITILAGGFIYRISGSPTKVIMILAAIVVIECLVLGLYNFLDKRERG